MMYVNLYRFSTVIYASLVFSLLQPISILIRLWAGVKKPLRFALWRQVTWMESSCTRELRGSNSSVSGTTR